MHYSKQTSCDQFVSSPSTGTCSKRKTPSTKLEETTLSSIPVTKHFIERVSKRRISGAAILLTLQRGEKIYQRGDGAHARILFRKDLPDDISPEMAKKILGTTVIVAADGSLLTAYKKFGVRPKDMHKTAHWLD
jgi:hypothetical protein